MGLASWFGWGTSSTGEELPDIFPLGLCQKDFVTIDVVQIYTKILTDVIERTQGLTPDQQKALWDNCLQSESSDGLISRLAKGMADKTELFLVYNPTLKLLRKATSEEESKIREDYKKTAASSVGTYISFKNYKRTDMVQLYSALEYSTVGALNKQMNVSKALQLKFADLRKSVAAVDSADVKAQAVRMATNLKDGKDIMLDAEDSLELAKPDLTATQSSMELIAQKRSFYLGMPASYITGEAPKGLGDTGEGDAKAVERGLKNYFVSIIEPVCSSVFGVSDKKLTFKSEDYRQLSTALEALKTFELTSDELIGHDNKLTIINKLFGQDPDTKGDAPEKVDPNNPPAVPGAKPVVPPKPGQPPAGGKA